ncbi:SDR family NAD(P)-dependent oxidoreductase [Azoarcus sp. KH32C]|uniref:SDR family NAD(P)-dependent oxidoreductase n=1 Tax=Azoarcus sp. KH32C TaxID=748247 RepID=UPI000238614C|nr:SDR family NAD(P)-dependent oxidoreductase [Azoarcus sp. KH32C]BAL24567.1 3-oxoacyl-[acyl-carrier protein] reductase [Azoarcus sp. KH32C]
MVCDLHRDAIDNAVEKIRAAGDSAHGYVMNVTDRGSIDAMVADVKARHGRIDVLVNNAGITRDARLVRMTEAQFDAVIDVNLKGIFNCTQAVVETMLAQGSGAILSTSSIAGVLWQLRPNELCRDQGRHPLGHSCLRKFLHTHLLLDMPGNDALYGDGRRHATESWSRLRSRTAFSQFLYQPRPQLPDVAVKVIDQSHTERPAKLHRLNVLADPPLLPWHPFLMSISS